MEGGLLLNGTSEYNGIVDDGTDWCRVGDGYDDVGEGSEVDVIAVGSLSTGQRTTSTTCAFDISVLDALSGESFYQVAPRQLVKSPTVDATNVLVYEIEMR